MAGRTSAGEMRTRIQVFDLPRDAAGSPELDQDGYPAKTPVNVLGAGRYFHCKWVNAHGSEIYEAKQAGLTEPATLTMRYTNRITTTCLIYREKDPDPYEVLSLNDVEDRHVWLEIRVQRKAAAK